MKITIKQAGYYDVAWTTNSPECEGRKLQFLKEGDEVELADDRALVARIGEGPTLVVRRSDTQEPHAPESAEAAAKLFGLLFSHPEVAAYFEQPAETSAIEYIRVRDGALIARCAEMLEKHGHQHAANSLRKMAREGKI
jgi:hypothetical protein